MAGFGMTNAILSNGAKILAMGPYRGDSSRIVLAEYLGKYVTWRAYQSSGADSPYDCFWGSYHSSLKEAENNFYSRVSS